MPVRLSQAFLLPGEVFLRPGHDQRHEYKAEEAGKNRGQGQDPAVIKHHDQGTGQHGDRCHQGTDALVHALPDRVYVIGHAAQYVSVADFIKILQRQAIDLFGYAGAQVFADLLGDGRHDIALRKAEHSGSGIKYNQRKGNAPDRVQIDFPHRWQAVHQGGQALHDQIGHVLEPVWADDLHHGANGGKRQSRYDGRGIALAVTDQPQPGFLEFLWLFHHAAHRASAHRAPTHRAAARLVFTHIASSSSLN